MRCYQISYLHIFISVKEEVFFYCRLFAFTPCNQLMFFVFKDHRDDVYL